MLAWLADVLGDVAASVSAGSDPYEIVAYRGYANERRALVHGRVLESPNVSAATKSDSLWRNLVNTLKRVESDPVSGARVSVTAGGVEREVVADEEGFFREWVDLPPLPPSEEPWREVELRLVAPLRHNQPDVRATAQLRVPEASATFGVISDRDDTVMQSRITNFLQAVRTVMLGNSRTRLPFPGVAAFYAALQRGGDGKRHNPIFYVSSSPWNIYDVIADFMEIQLIPVGPILLRDWDIKLSALSSNRLRGHKEPLIREILDLYPSLPFVLIGDNSQKDPEIYRSILDHYPGRILAIYIRNVENHPERSESVKALADEVLAAGSTLVLADDSYVAAVHASDHGWITKESLPSVRQEEKADEGHTGTKADVPGVPEEPAAPTIIVE
ncbi:MAG: App1 family protein [Gemmatimonadaceae bacterium]